MASRFETGAPNDPQMTLNHTTSNVAHICTTCILESQISLCLALQGTAHHFEIQVILRQVHRMTLKRPWTLQNHQRYSIYASSIAESQISPLSVLLYYQPFSRYRTFYYSPLTTMLNGQKITKKKLPKIKNSHFFYGRDHSQEYTQIWGNKSGVYFQRMCLLKHLLPYSPMLTKTKKKIANKPKCEVSQFFEQKRPLPGECMMGVNLMCTFRGDVVSDFYSHMVPYVSENEKRKS